jgi:PKD repeat protein
LLLGSTALAQDSLIHFNNSVFGNTRLVTDSFGKPLVGTNWVAELFLDTPTGLLNVTGPGSGLFSASGSGTPGVWSGGTRLLEKVSFGQTAQVEVRVWDLSLFSTYEAALQAGGVTGTSGLFNYSFTPSSPLAESDSWMKNFPSIRLTDQPALPPLIEAIRHPEPQEGDELKIQPVISGGTPPLRYLWQAGNGLQATNEVLDLSSQAVRPGLLDFNLTVTDADGRATPPAQFRLSVSNRAPVIRGVVAPGVTEGQRAQVQVQADYAWPERAVKVTWQLPGGVIVEGRQPTLPLLPPGRHDLKVQVEELGLISLYDNLDSVVYPAEFHVPTLETGDEVEFAIAGQTLHEVSIYYFADLSAMTAAERSAVTGELRIYRNDGPTYPGLQSRTPGTLLYKSQPFSLNSGYFLQRFTDLNVETTDRITWTVVWNNLPQISGKTAGLIVGDVKQNPAPTNRGKSYNDFWVHDGDRWELLHLGDYRPVANFATRATAVGTDIALKSELFGFTLTVTNTAPVLASVLVPENLVAGLPGQFKAIATDAGSTGLRYVWSFGDGATAEGPTVAHTYKATGTFSGKLEVTDANGAASLSSHPFQVQVDADWLPLAFLDIPPVDAIEGQLYSSPISVTPGGLGQTVTLKPVTVPAWLKWQATSALEGTLSGTPGPLNAGSHLVRFEATDGKAVEAFEYLIQVQSLNEAPSISAPAQIEVHSVDGYPEIALLLADPDPADALTLTVESGNPVLLPQDRLVLGGSGYQRTLSILPMSAGAGVVPIRLTVSDGRLSTTAVIEAKFQAPGVFTVGLQQSKGGNLAIDPAGDQFEEGFPIRVTAAVNPGWQLMKWLGLPNGPQDATDLDVDWEVSQSAVLSAQFKDIAAPAIAWSSPSAGVSEANVVTLVGWITDNDQVASAVLKRSGSPAQALKLTDGRYEVTGVRLDAGENVFAIEATDVSGNATTNLTSLVWNPGSILVVGDARDTREGQRVEFPIQLKSIQPLSGISFNLRYADYVDFLADPEFVSTLNTNTPGLVRVTVATAGVSIPAGVTPVGSLSLRVRSLLSPIGLMAYLDPELLEVSNELGDPVAGVSGVSGQTRLLPRKLVGDANGNNRLDIGDASLVQRLLVGLDPKRSWDIALNDLNKSGNLDSGDVVRVMRAAVGLDVQPKLPTMGAEWPPVAQPKSGKTAPSWIELTPGTFNAQRGGIFEAQIRIRQGPARLRGLAFELAYPAQFMSLVSGTGYVPGPALPAGALKYWNDTPTAGRLRFAASSETNWPITDGVIATFRFKVGQTVPPQWQGEYGLRAFEISIDGYNLENTDVPLSKVALEGEIAAPKVNRIRLNSGGTLQFDVLANTGSTLVLEGTSDLRSGNAGWKPLTTRVHDQLPLFLDPSKGIQSQAVQFYRIRSQAPAYITQPGVKGGR